LRACVLFYRASKVEGAITTKSARWAEAVADAAWKAALQKAPGPLTLLSGESSSSRFAARSARLGYKIGPTLKSEGWGTRGPPGRRRYKKRRGRRLC